MATNKDFIVKNGLSVGGDVAITGNVTSDLHLNDNAKIKVGTATDGDLQIYHNVNNSFIEDVGTGSLYLRADASVRIQSYGDNNDMIKADKAGAVTLYHNNGSRLDTTASGVNVTGTVDMDGFTSVGNGTITGDVLIQKGSGFPRITLQDLDGTNTRAFIQYSANTLHLTSQNNTANGRIVFSRYDGTTTATSGYFDATGKLFASSDLDVSGNVVSSGDISAVNTTLTGYLRGPASFTIDPAAHGDDTGTVIIAGNLQVDGTQTTINSTSLTVDDLNLTLASGAADSAAANGAGITVDGASASLTYAHSGTKFVFNKPLDVSGILTTGNITVNGATSGIEGGEIFLAGAGTNEGINIDNYTGIFRIFDGSSPAVRLSLDTGGNAIFAGTISSGAITSTTGTSTFAGNVGIGTDTPDAKLHVVGANDNNLIIQNSTYQGSGQNTEAAIRFKVNSSSDAERAKAGIHFKNDGSAYGRGDLHFTVDSADDNGNVDINDSKMVITHEGNVGIGTGAPFSKLDLRDTGWSSGAPYGTVAYVEGGGVNDLNWGHLVVTQSGTTTDTGGRISLGANGQNPIAGIRAKYKGATYGDLAFLTRPSGGTNTERMVITSTGQVNIGETPALVSGNNPRHILHLGGTTVNPSYEQLSMAGGSTSLGQNNTIIRMANVGNAFYLTNNYYNWGTNRFDETNEGQAFFKMGEDGRFSFGGRSSATTDSPTYNAGIGYDGSISAGNSSTMVNGLGKLNVWGNSDTSDADVELRLYDNDTTSGSVVPAVAFYKGSGSGPVRFADIRANDANGVSIRDGSGNDLFTVGLTGLITQPGATRISDSSYASPTNWVAGDWVTTHTIPYGEVVGEVGIEWNTLDAPSGSHHGWNTLRVGSHYSSYVYGWETTLELLDHTAHNAFYFDQWRVIRPDGYSNGQDLLLQGRISANVTAGSLRSWVLNRVGSNNSAVTPVTPVVNNTPTGNTMQARLWTYARMKKSLYGDMAITGDLSIGRLKAGEDTRVEIVTDEAGTYDAILQLGSGQYTTPDVTTEGFQLWYDNSTGHTYFNNTYSDGDMIFVTASSTDKATTPQRMKIDHDGWVVVGTGNAAGQDNVSIGPGRIMLDKSNDWNIESGLGSSNGSHIRFKHGTTDRGSITTSTSGTTFNTASDIRLKDNIKTIENGKEKLLKLNPVTHTWKEDESGVTVHGFIAQEVQDIIPEAIAGDEDTMMSMDYGRITPVIVAALQDALKEIEELKSRISDMENK